MSDRPRGGLTALCITQTTSWGLLFYSLPVAVAPISDDTGWSHTAITAALSVGLIVSALVGFRVGRILDQQGPRNVMTLGSIIGVVALALVAWSPNLILFIAAWVVAGFAQAAVLYQPAFVVITRWYGPRRVGPLTTLTLVAGLASTIFAPITAALIDAYGWRVSYLIMAGILGAITIPLHARFLNRSWSPLPHDSARKERTDVRSVTRSARFIMLTVSMALATFTLFAVTINVIPLMLERGMSYTAASWALGLVGAGQLIGRIGYAPLTRMTTPRTRTLIIFGVGALSLWALAGVSGPAWVLIAIAIIAGGARGCHTLLQATAVSDRWGSENFGKLNARFHAPMTMLSALAPVSGPAIAGGIGGYAAMAVLMAAILTGSMLLAART